MTAGLGGRGEAVEETRKPSIVSRGGGCGQSEFQEEQRLLSKGAVLLFRSSEISLSLDLSDFLHFI